MTRCGLVDFCKACQLSYVYNKTSIIRTLMDEDSAMFVGIGSRNLQL